MLFVSWKRVISLEEAARQISDEEKIDEKTLKTKIRRLYDIANVLQSIGLIAKTQSPSRKPAFKWIGLHGAIESIREIKELVRRTRETTRPVKVAAAKEPTKKHAKTADPSPNNFTPNLLKCNVNAVNFRGFADGFSLKGRWEENKLNNEFKCDKAQSNLFDNLIIESSLKDTDQFTI